MAEHFDPLIKQSLAISSRMQYSWFSCLRTTQETGFLPMPPPHSTVLYRFLLPLFFVFCFASPLGRFARRRVPQTSVNHQVLTTFHPLSPRQVFLILALLRCIFCLPLKLSTILTSWRHTVIPLIPKLGNPSDPSNYPQVSITHISKLF